MGIPRVLEALQSNDWTSLEADEDEGTEGGAGDDEDMDMDFVVDPEDFEGLRKAIWSSGKGTGEFEDEELELMRASISGSAAAGGKNAEKGEGGGGNEHMDMELGDEEVQKLERMMLKLQAVKDRSAGLPEEQRKRLAKQAVDEVMKEL
ncbi:hypothetical protein B0T17DRAFT_517368 [Bombardia bombarda]|uniref:Uncharacterized protein n=1 Tax=Bombardia bombarda TaxID=252184 RepID=A0AA39XKR1_9PEZI|nr:hypothetical protein B0T17DRAFT_517368 [Bombardia bombarda]